MKNIFQKTPSLIAMLLTSIMLLFSFAVVSQAATQNYSVAIPGVQTLPLHLSGQYTVTETGVVQFAIPFKCRVVGVTASARASGGTAPTLTVDVQDDAVSILSAPVSVTAGTVTEGSISNPVLIDESVITVNLAITGTSPTWDDITVLITMVRE